MLTHRELIVGALLAVLGGLAWWYSASLAPGPEVTTESARQPDYIVEDVTGVTMDASGRPARRLTTPQLRHYPDDESSEVDYPVLLVFNEKTPPWRIRSERGWISADGDELLLEGAVRAERDAAPSLDKVVLVTSEMLFFPETDYAETDRFAELERGKDWVTATDGMQVWFGEPMRIKFFGRTRVSFAQSQDTLSRTD
ncbi:MAG: LPS export ABC transporter periplasmic protein LptC [Thiohalocapsa sp.]